MMGTPKYSDVALDLPLDSKTSWETWGGVSKYRKLQLERKMLRWEPCSCLVCFSVNNILLKNGIIQDDSYFGHLSRGLDFLTICTNDPPELITKKLKKRNGWLCVYFMMRSNEVVYIGKTHRPRHRMKYHHKINNSIDSVTFWFPVPCLSEAEIYRLESILIRKLRPRLNGRL